ncbi:hypothetical protein PV396_34940 [Streptomyces sp. ME02-8801-2C]|uniref:hypothetical protein n=1 Tax=Streptomyces sp. ME02-8801-2C TaxID=3028680 RepID=UPI0029B6F5F8|nr:hypothetical protein [Streptomyces sp. ME02-8801-2C]MDX3457093.1 hypothetical protein [Streptomyces sp. ME02-8801-2C]
MPDAIHIVSRYAEHRPGRASRITGVMLHLLFDLTQQTARVGSSSNPWAHLAAYDADAFAAFLPGESA